MPKKTTYFPAVRDVYNTPLVSALEPLEVEGFANPQNQDPDTLQNELYDVGDRVDRDVPMWKTLANNRTDLKALARKMQPELDKIYPTGKTRNYGEILHKTDDRTNSLKMQIQDDTTDMIQGSSNILVLSGIAITTISIFIVVSMI